MTPEEERLAALTNKHLVEELAAVELPEPLWVEIGLRPGVEGMNGIRVAAIHDARTGEQAVRLRRFMTLWELERQEAAYTERTRRK
jgi:hypothetical protein